jgi:AraC-like DNA-binding protein
LPVCCQTRILISLDSPDADAKSETFFHSLARLFISHYHGAVVTSTLHKGIVIITFASDFSQPGAGDILLNVCFRLFYKTCSMNIENRLKKSTIVLIYAIQRDIKTNPLKNKKVHAIAKEAGIDRKVLEAGFKLLFGVTLKKYQMVRKLEFSQQMLDEARFTIKEIAFKCGYSSHNSYTKAFKKIYKQTPTDWQNRLKVA